MKRFILEIVKIVSSRMVILILLRSKCIWRVRIFLKNSVLD